jgi:predicted ATPase/transcriptional regulator with XRE-family HTH domain
MDTQPDASLGTAFRDLRLAAGLTQEALAERAGISARSLRDLERGASLPYKETVQRLAAALELDEQDGARLLAAATPAPRRRTAPAGTAVHAEPAPPTAQPLPIPPTPLIGRAAEVAMVAALLHRDPHAADPVRLVTLTGPGGVGKTRLGLAVAAAVGPVFPQGVAFVPLASIADPALVPAALARALAVRESAARPLWDGILSALRPRAMLVLLDNFEHLLPAAPLLAELLATCQSLALLVTSRSLLHLRAEHRVEVRPLGVPANGGPSHPDQCAAAPAVALFLERARAIQVDFSLTTENASVVAAISRRLDGLPLALELAAARLTLLAPATLLARLERQLGVLVGGAQDLPERQQTMRATIAWSFDLLPVGERNLLRRLAVFAGGCTLAAAEAVCGAGTQEEGDPLGRLGGLVDKSLVRRELGEDGESRVGMLETVREFALERLVAAGEAAALERWHAEYYLALAEEAEQPLLGPAQRAWLGRLEAEHDNLRVALRWSAREDDRLAIGARLAAALLNFWWIRGHWREGRRWLEEMAADAGTVPLVARARVAQGAGVLAEALGDFGSAAAHYATSRALGEALDDTAGTARALIGQGAVAMHRGEADAARDLLETGLTLGRRAGDPRLIAHALVNLGSLALGEGAGAAAEGLLEESLALYAEVGDRWGINMPANVLGTLALRRGDHARAWTLFAESLARYREAGNPTGMAIDLEGLAMVAAEYDPLPAAHLLGAAAAVHEPIGSQHPPLIQPDYARALARICMALGEDGCAAALASGREMGLEDAMRLALQSGTAPPSPH